MSKYKPSDLMGKGVADHLKGTRLAAHLLEVRDRFGSGDSYIKALAGMALKGKVTDTEGRDIFSSIRDRLIEHADNDAFAHADPNGNGTRYKKQAKDLAYGLNWHRVNDALQLDQFVSDHVKGLASDRLKANGNVHRAARDLFVKGKGNAEHASRFWDSLHAMADRQVGPDSALGLSRKPSREQLEASLERLARLEEYRQELGERGRRQIKDTRPSVGAGTPKPVEQVDTLNWLAGSGPAYTHNKNADGFQVRIGKNLDAEQYRTEDDAVRFALGIGRALERLGEAPERAVDLISRAAGGVDAGLSRAGRAIGQSIVNAPSRIGRSVSSGVKSLLPAAPLPKGPDGVIFEGTTGSARNDVRSTHPANMERQAIEQNLHQLGVINTSDPKGHSLNQMVVNKYADAMRRAALIGTHGVLGNYRGKVQSYGRNHAFTQGEFNGLLAPAVKHFAEHHFGHLTPPDTADHLLDKADTIDLVDPDEHLPFGEEHNPDDELPFGDEHHEPEAVHTPEPEPVPSEPARTPEPAADDDFDPVAWAAGRKAQPVGDDVPLPVVGKAKKSGNMKLNDLKQRVARESKGFDLLRELESNKVDPKLWPERLKALKLTKAQATSIIKKFGKMTDEQKSKDDPLKFAMQLSHILKGRV